jgi:hypothetical protein
MMPPRQNPTTNTRNGNSSQRKRVGNATQTLPARQQDPERSAAPQQTNNGKCFGALHDKGSSILTDYIRSAHSRASKNLDWYVIGLDLGTSTYSAFFKHLRPGTNKKTAKSRKIFLESRSRQELVGPMKAAWHNDRWYVGFQVDDLTDLPEESIIRDAKLLLYDKHRTTERARKVVRQLKAIDPDRDEDDLYHELLVHMMRYIWDDVWNYVEVEILGNSIYTRPYERLVYIPVPILAAPDATAKLAAAAKEAGLPRIYFSCGADVCWRMRARRAHGRSKLATKIVGQGNVDPSLKTSSMRSMLIKADCTPVGRNRHGLGSRLWRRHHCR